MTATEIAHGAFLAELRAALPADSLLTERAARRRFLRDNSWLSPVLAEHFGERREAVLAGGVAVASPATEDELRTVLATAVRHRVPVTPRGRGTSNFGGSFPLDGGILLDLTRLDAILAISDTSVTAQAGAIVGTLASAAQGRGRELTVMTTTYAGATLGGWIAGGHVGIGSGLHGTVWDGNVLSVRLLTAEDPPRELTLDGDELLPVLHAAGTTGVIVEATLPLVPRGDWCEAVVAFPTFGEASQFVVDLAHERDLRARVATAVDGQMVAGLTPLRDAVAPGESAALLVIDAPQKQAVNALAVTHGGRYVAWDSPERHRVPVEAMVYGHRLLWNKRQAPDAAFLHVYLAPGRELQQLDALDRRFGEAVWRELKFVRSAYLRALRGMPPDDDLVAACVLALLPGERRFIDEVIAYCDANAIGYLNPHTFVLEESGLFADFDRLLAFKARVDPAGLLNPGKLGRHFFVGEASA